jgi:hypothetical protein
MDLNKKKAEDPDGFQPSSDIQIPIWKVGKWSYPGGSGRN